MIGIAVWVGRRTEKSPANPPFWAATVLGMGENILGGKAREIEPNPVRQETKTRRGQLLAALPHQHGVQPLFERVQIEDVGGSVGNLRVGEFRRAPVR